MKKIAFLAAAACAALASPAMAQQNVTGTITLTGNVGAKCFVGSNNTATSFTASHDFLELAQADGTLRSGLATELDGDATMDFTVKCNTGNPTVTISRTSMTTANSPATGYTNTISYNGIVVVDKVTGPAVTFDTDAGTAPLATGQLGGAIAATGPNVHVTANTFAATGILVAGAYSGQISITIAPTV